MDKKNTIFYFGYEDDKLTFGVRRVFLDPEKFAEALVAFMAGYVENHHDDDSDVLIKIAFNILEIIAEAKGDFINIEERHIMDGPETKQ